jgi:hypothetical protein
MLLASSQATDIGAMRPEDEEREGRTDEKER